jgi:uncharacterized membrane protein
VSETVIVRGRWRPTVAGAVPLGLLGVALGLLAAAVWTLVGGAAYLYGRWYARGGGS